MADTDRRSTTLLGRSLRKVVPRGSHAEWAVPADRPDPVGVITAQNAGRLERLVPIRHLRMSESPFTFYRGAAALMAQDLASTPATGLEAQICGDAHLSNFGAYGSPERALVFDLNDFDETLPGPWEWDVKRLAASFAIAARHNEFSEGEQADLAGAAAAAYQHAMARFASMKYLDVFYAHLSVEAIHKAFGGQLSKRERKANKKFERKARTKDSVHTHKKLTQQIDGVYRIRSQAPLIVPLREMPGEEGPSAVESLIAESFRRYLETVPNHIERLLRRFTYADAALKVVGVGSVGTRCYVVLLEGRDEDDPLFLQIKEASRSVLEGHLPASRYRDHGHRVVEGQRLMQSSSDSFLGWMTSPDADRDFYWRQFKDMKASLEVEGAPIDLLKRYAGLCGWTLARAHARSGDSAAIAGYVGSGKKFARAISEFSLAYADQNQRDFDLFRAAIARGWIEAATADEDRRRLGQAQDRTASAPIGGAGNEAITSS